MSPRTDPSFRWRAGKVQTVILFNSEGWQTKGYRDSVNILSIWDGVVCVMGLFAMIERECNLPFNHPLL
jgi:hypothetical protein